MKKTSKIGICLSHVYFRNELKLPIVTKNEDIFKYGVPKAKKLKFYVICYTYTMEIICQGQILYFA